MSSPVLNLSSSIECPKCGKHAIVTHQSGLYRCLNCNFERDLKAESSEETQNGIGELVFAIAGFLMTAALVL